MLVDIKIDSKDSTPVYKQIIDQVVAGQKSGAIQEGDMLPSMNHLAEEQGVSRETAKKAYTILRNNGIVIAKQGKGFYVAPRENDKRRTRILLLFDKLSNIKQTIFNAFSQTIGDHADINIYFHDQQVEVLDYYISNYIDDYDYFVITPHFPLDAVTQKRVIKILRRIPNRKLIILDNLLSDLPGNYGSVYQDFANDAYNALTQEVTQIAPYGQLNVIVEPTSLYYPKITGSVKRFCAENKIEYKEYNHNRQPEKINPGDVFLIINGQLDMGLINIVREARSRGLKPGADIKIISYNESPLDEIILNGLTTISADFHLMGELAARMIMGGNMSKIHCDFKMTQRATF